MDVLGMLDPIALQGAEIVAVPELVEQLLEDGPVAIAAGRAEFAFEVALQIGLDAVIVEQCVVDVDKEDGLVERTHHAASTFEESAAEATCLAG